MQKDVSTSLGYFSDDLTEFFLEKSYGNGISEFRYITVCEDKFLFERFKDETILRPRAKRIECVVELEYNKVQSLNNRGELYKHCKQRYIGNAMNIYEMDIKDFDLESYIADLEAFFDFYQAKRADSDKPINEIDYEHPNPQWN